MQTARISLNPPMVPLDFCAFLIWIKDIQPHAYNNLGVGYKANPACGDTESMIPVESEIRYETEDYQH